MNVSKSCMVVCFFFALSLFVVAWAAPVAGKQILTEGTVWRTHVTWGAAMCMGATGAKPAKMRRSAKITSEPLLDGWANPTFDDSGWGLWREIHVGETLKGGSTPLYTTRQYGAQQSPFMRRRCLRGKFNVKNPAGVKKLTLTMVYRGGVAVYLNGKKVGSSDLSKVALADPMGLADVYPKDVYFRPDGKAWGLKSGSIGSLVFDDDAILKDFNQRMRTLNVDIPVSGLRAGVNVLALDVRVAPIPEKLKSQDWWNACGFAVIDLRAQGEGVGSALDTSSAVHLWVAGPLFNANPFGSVSVGRVGNGRQVLLWNIPMCNIGETDGVGSIQIVGAKNGTFSEQVVLSSRKTIKNLKAVVSPLSALDGTFTIPASACDIRYMTYSSTIPSKMNDPSISLLDALYKKAPVLIPVLPEKPFPGMPDISSRTASASWCEGGAVASVWFRVKLSKDVPEGMYTGALTVSAEGMTPVAVPISIKVHGYVLPDPADFTPHVGLLHSPDSIALKYDVPLWSDRHFALMEKTLEKMGELGGDVVYIPLITKTWLGNAQTMVRWVKKGGKYQPDFTLFDRYIDLVCKYLKPKVICLYVFHSTRKDKVETPVVTTIDGDKIGEMNPPPYGPTPEAIAFWKPLISEINKRLEKKGLGKCVTTLGMAFEGGRRREESAVLKPVVALFKEAWPEGQWANLAHFGGKGSFDGVPFGYIMSVWGNESKIRSKHWGAPDLPFILVKHFRADPVIDLRPVASRGSLYWATETAMGATFWGRGGDKKRTQGIGPLGMDFWNFTAKENRRPGAVEGRIANLTMSGFSTAAFLAPGPNGPIATARFETFREGLQVCEARTVIERALEGGKLKGALAERCSEVSKSRMGALNVLGLAECNAQREGWAWFEGGKWRELTDEVFACAGEVMNETEK